MIHISYEDGIKVTTQDLEGVFDKEQLPLTVEVKNSVSKNVIWTSKLGSYMWMSYPSSEMNDVVIKDAKDNFVTQYYWNVFEHGSFFYKSLWLYCKSLINKGVKPKGLVIGTHDGEFGEWVPLVRNFLSNMILVEATEETFHKLKKNYEGKDGLVLLNKLVSMEGGEVDFYEGGRGYTNSIVERVIRSWENEEIKTVKKSSVGVNDILKEHGRIDWLHLDIEGLDAKLILSIKEEYLPNFIIFEDYNLLEDERIKLTKYLTERKYKLKSDAGICLAVK